ncbi:hypothetical protein LA080_006200 [Diaporthe eres]|nr:hypothetical protein LA080_006200 [Diaporthe eres]
MMLLTLKNHDRRHILRQIKALGAKQEDVNPRVLKHQDPRDLRFTVGLGEKILEISSRELEPSSVAVSQDSGYQVISTFDIKPGEPSRVSVPGSFPFWKDPKLPTRLPQEGLDKTQPQDHQSKAFSMLMLSAQTSTEFRYDQVDIVTHASLLSMLLRLTEAPHMRTFRLFIKMIQGSLALAYDPILPPSGERETLLSAVRECCTEMPPDLKHSAHYRSVQYSFGHLNCVVQSRVDALCSTSPGELQSSSSPSPGGSVVGQGYHLQGEAAVIQVRRGGRQPNGLPIDSLWFSRTPLLLRATLGKNSKNSKKGTKGTKGTITKVTKIDASAAGRGWEKDESHQVALRKLATLLSDLKRAVKLAAPNGQACFGLIERHVDPPTLQVFLSEDKSEVEPKDISNNPWVGKTSHGPDEASNSGGRDSHSEAKPPQDKTSRNTQD